MLKTDHYNGIIATENIDPDTGKLSHQSKKRSNVVHFYYT